MEDILINIDSKYRDNRVYPNETKFRIDLDKPYKNIMSARIISMEINNSISYLDDTKRNNFITFNFPNKTNDPEGTSLILPRGLFQSITPIQSVYNAYFTQLVNSNKNMRTLSKERYFYIFYLNDSVTINFKTHNKNSNIGPIVENEYTNIDYTQELGNITIPSGWHSLYGLVVQIKNYLKSLTIPYNVFKMSTFSLRIWDRRFRKPNTNDDNIRIDTINELDFGNFNINTNFNNLRDYIYFNYVNDTTNFVTSNTGTGIMDKLTFNTYIIPVGYTKGGSALLSGSKYHMSNNKSSTPVDTDIQLYNLSMFVDFTRVMVYFKNSFTADTTTNTQFYYYYVDDTTQTWDKQDDNGNQVNTLIGAYLVNYPKDIPTFGINLNTYNDIDYANNNGIFDIKRMRYPTLGFYLGYRLNEYTSINDQTDQVIYAEKIFDTTGDDYIFIKINNWGHFDFFGQRLFGKILMTSGLGNPKLEDYISKEYKFKQPTNIQRLDIELIDYLGNSIDMNGFDFSFTLELKQVTNSELKNDFEQKYLLNKV